MSEAKMTQRIIDRSYVGEVLQHIYSSDLNVNVKLSLQGGYFYIDYLGQNKESLQGTTIEEAVTHLAHRLAKDFPDSSFSQWWMQNFAEAKERW